MDFAFHKRHCFEHEKEWRAVVYRAEERATGIAVPVDLQELIVDVHVGPRAQPFVLEGVSALLRSFGLEKPLLASSLLKAPRREP